MRPVLVTLLLAFVLAVAAGPARADATRDALAELAKCADIADSTLRLKCFDDAMPRAKSALAAPEPARRPRASHSSTGSDSRGRRRR